MIVEQKKVALIACPWVFFDEVEFRSQQLGLGYVGAYAQSKGHRITAFIDPMTGGGENIRVPVKTRYQTVNRCGFSDDWIVSQIPKNVDVIGINAPFTDSRLLLYPLVKRIKMSFPDVLVVVGGVLATTLPRQVLEESGTDVVIMGEGEIPFSRILNGDPLKNIPGIAYKIGQRTFLSPFRSEQIKNVNEIPFPGYGLRPMSDYVVWSPRGNRADRTLSIVTSRGCPFKCEFCSIPEKGQHWRPFSAERVVREIDMAVEKWGINHIEFEDDNFTLREGRALEILTHLHYLRKSGRSIFCSFPNGVMIDRMTEVLVCAMKSAGAEIAYLPVESGDERVLAAMNKHNIKHHLEKVLEVTRWCAKAGLAASCFVIVGYPGSQANGKLTIGEDEQAFQNTLNFCRKLIDAGAVGISPLIATPYPGTEMFNFCQTNGYLAHPDEKNVLTTISYAKMRPEFVQIETPWCSREQAYERWKTISNEFPIFHNVQKK